MSLARSAESAEIYLVTGDDSLDDPAWGITPIWRGTVAQAVAWLMLEPDISRYSVMIDCCPLWAKDFLAAEIL